MFSVLNFWLTCRVGPSLWTRVSCLSFCIWPCLWVICVLGRKRWLWRAHPAAALGCPQWTSFPPVHWLVSPAAAGGLQQGFSKDFLNSVSCGVTSPVPLLPLLVLLFLHTDGDHEVGELTTDPWNQLLSFLLGRQRKSQRRWLLSYRGCHSHLTSTACHLPEWQKVGSICLLQCDWITKKQLADGKFIFQDTYNNHHWEDTGANLDANGIAQLELITEGSGFLYAQFHSYVSS